MNRSSVPDLRGPFRADQLHPGDSYELSNGHPVYCSPTGARGARATIIGAGVLASDPAVQDVGLDAGFSPSPDMLRAPDIAVGNVPDEPGWVQGVPPLAVEYADTGQDEEQLALKIGELLAAGTRFIWVVRLTGPRRVEVHEPGKGVRIARPGDELLAPGILANPVPVEALYDQETAQDLVFRNLLQRQGYDSLDALREEAEAEGEVRGEARGELQTLRNSIVQVLEARGLPAGDDLRIALDACADPEALKNLVRRAAVADSPDEVLATLR